MQEALLCETSICAIECADPTQEEETTGSKLWIIGAVLGSLAAIIVLVICVCIIKPYVLVMTAQLQRIQVYSFSI